MTARSAYVHIPFCAHKCDFCDFAVAVGLDRLAGQYCSIVAREIKERIALVENKESLQTVFYGGGTPGYIDPELISLIHQQLQESIGIAKCAEITIETTPEAITEKKAYLWLESGINRISIGVESLVDKELVAVGRKHTRLQAIEGINCAYKAGFQNVSLDLMYGLPEQTQKSWITTLDELLAFVPQHLSAYGLTLANNSPLLLRYPHGSAQYPNEESFAAMYEILVDRCLKAGLRQYEIANFARADFECRHNLCYWRNEEYFGFGVSAHRYVNGRRSSNFRSIRRYMDSYLACENMEIIDEPDRMKEAIFLGLRLRQGIDLKKFHKDYSVDLVAHLGDRLLNFCRDGFMKLERDTLCLTQKGVLVSNTILAELI